MSINTLQCASCQRFMRDFPGYACEAYPDGIPSEIIHAEHDHRKPFPGDHGLRFKPIKEEAA